MGAERLTVTHCPDCGRDIPSEEFIAHREAEHPPRTISIVPEGIRSQEAHGYQPTATEE